MGSPPPITPILPSSDNDRTHMPTLPELLKTTVDRGGSDLHLTTNTPPQVRVDGKLNRLELPDLSPAETKQLTYSVLTDAQKKRFEEALELDFSFGIKGLARFRCNMFNQRGAVAAVYRLIPERIRTFEELNLPQVLDQARREAARPRARDRTDRQRQVHDAGRDDRQGQLRAQRAHPHHRGSRSSTSTRTSGASSTSASCTATRRASPWPCAPPCARTPTSSSSARCATSRPSSPPCALPRPAT